MLYTIIGYVLGVASGIGFGRFFCKWHHKNDENIIDIKIGGKSVKDMMGQDCCQQPFTIGEQMEGQGGCHDCNCGEK